MSRPWKAALGAATLALAAAAPALAQQGGAPAPAAAAGPGPQLLFFGQLLLVFVIMYFLLIRPQQKRQQDIKKMQEALKKGDRVVTQAGILGTVANVNGDTVLLKVADEVKIEFQKSAVVGMVAEKK
jgi:preprotein translocase subunit YajC